LTDAQATVKNIRQAFADISAEAGDGCSVLVVFDMCTVEIQGGPEAGFYFCPHDYRCGVWWAVCVLAHVAQRTRAAISFSPLLTAPCV